MEYLKYWMIGTATAWASVAAGYAYLKLGGPLPSTQKYLLDKYERTTNLLQTLEEKDAEQLILLDQRRENRTVWRQDREALAAQLLGGVDLDDEDDL